MKNHEALPPTEQYHTLEHGLVSTTIIDPLYIEELLEKPGIVLPLHESQHEDLPHPCTDAAISYMHDEDTDIFQFAGHISIDPTLERITGTAWQRQLMEYLTKTFEDEGERVIRLPQHLTTFYMPLDDVYATSVSLHEGTLDSSLMFKTELLSDIFFAMSDGSVEYEPHQTHETPRYDLLHRFVNHWNFTLSCIQQLYEEQGKTYNLTVPLTRPIDSDTKHEHTQPRVSIETLETLRPTFNDIGGASAAKEFLTTNALAITHPELASRYGVQAEDFLLVGPAGTGKTTLAHAFAGSIKAEFREYSSTEIVDKYIGESGKQLKRIFDSAKTLSHPVVLFFDEVDSILPKGPTSSERQDVKNIFKKELTDLKKYPNIIVTAATNKDMQDFDEALVRAGRLRAIDVPTPTDQERAEIWQVLLARSVAELDGDTALTAMLAEEPLQSRVYADDLDLNELTRYTDGYTGADIEQVLHEARKLRFEEAVRTGSMQPVDQDVLLFIIERYLKP